MPVKVNACPKLIERCCEMACEEDLGMAKATSEETLTTALGSLAAAIDRLAKAIEGQGMTSGKVYSTMEPLKGQTLAESIRYLGDMMRPLETHTHLQGL